MISRIQNGRKRLPVSFARFVIGGKFGRGYATSGMHRVYETSKVSGKANLKLNIEIEREMKG